MIRNIYLLLPLRHHQIHMILILIVGKVSIPYKAHKLIIKKQQQQQQQQR